MGIWYNFEEIGLPHGHAYPELQYQPTVEMIVARTRCPRPESPIDIYRLSARHKDDIGYHPICELDDSKSVFSFSVCLTRPVLYYSVHETSDGGSN